VKARPFLIGFFVLVAAFAAASFYFSATIDKPERTRTALVSPDGKFKAVAVTLAGGGAQPFCLNSVSVLLAVYPDEFAEREKAYEVYAAPCAAFATGDVSPKLEWLSGTALQIAHAAYAAGAKAPRFKTIDVTKSVHVTFVERD
jgi:hypothetical protein